MISKIIHQIWVGPNPLPETYVPLIEKIKAIHPDWEHHLWTEDNLPKEAIRDEWRNKLRMPAERSDLLRLDLLYKLGGIYLDIDFDLHKPLDPILEMAPIVVCDLKPGRINNAFIAAVPAHPIVHKMIMEAKPREYFGLDKEASGSLFVDRMLEPYKGEQVMVLPPACFYALEPTEESYATHLYDRSWKQEEDWKKIALRAEKRLLVARERISELENAIKLDSGKPARSQPGLKQQAGDVSSDGEGEPQVVSKSKSKSKSKIKVEIAAAQMGKKAKQAKALYSGMLSRSWAKVAPRLFSKQSRKRIEKLANPIWLRKKAVKSFWSARFTATDWASRVSGVPLHRYYLAYLLNRRGLTGEGAEIGVKRGIHSQVILSRWKGRKLYLVDPWEEQDDESYVDRANVYQERHNEFLDETLSRMQEFGGRFEILRDYSVEAAKRIPDESLDFVYIDARHDYDSVLEDLHAWYPKVKDGGIIAGHDYLRGLMNGIPYGVKEAVRKFTNDAGYSWFSVKRTWEPWPSFYFVKVKGRQPRMLPASEPEPKLVVSASQPARRAAAVQESSPAKAATG